MKKRIVYLLLFSWVLFITFNYILDYQAQINLQKVMEKRFAFNDRINQFAEYLSQLKSAETGQRGYIITNKLDYLEPYFKAVNYLNLPSTQAFLDKEGELNPEFLSQIARIKELQRLKMEELQKVLELHRTKGFQEAKTIISNDLGKRLMDEIRNLVNERIRHLSQLIDVEDQNIKSEFHHLILYHRLGNLFYVLLSGAFAYILYRRIMDAQESQKEKEETKQDLDFVLNAAKIGTWDWDLTTHKLTWNEMTHEIFGFPKNVIPTFQMYMDLTHPDDRKRLNKLIQESLNKEIPFKDTYRIFLPDGRMRNVTSRGRTFYDRDKKPLRMAGIVWDVTDIKHSESLLQVSESIYKIFNESESIEETSHKILAILKKFLGWDIMAIWELKPASHTLECIHCFHDPVVNIPMFEESLYHLEGLQSVPNQVLSTYKPIWYTDFSEEGQLIRAQAASKEGIKGYLAFPIFGGNEITGVVELFKKEALSSNEIDEAVVHLVMTIGIEMGQFLRRKETENLLRRMQEKYSTYVEITEEWIWEMNRNYVFTFSNSSVEKSLGYKPQELIGKTMFDFIAENELISVRTAMQTFVEKKKGCSQKLISWKAKNGMYHQLEVNAEPIINDQNDVLGFRGACTDVTERINMDKTKNEFISLISHELRTPLTSISGALKLINADPGVPSDLKQLVDIAYRNSDRLIRLINDILDIERIELGKFEIHMKTLSLNQVIKEAINISLQQAKKFNVTLIQPEINPLVQVNGDYDRLIQVMLNLLSNAIKFSPSQGIVNVFLDVFDTVVRVSVSDQGPGIPSEFKGRIFGRFAQADSSNSRSREGTGLGLNICKSIIEQMGGNINFHSEVGKGSTFYFELPISKAVI